MTIAWIAAGVLLLALELHNVAFYAVFAAVGCFAAAFVAIAAPDAILLQVLAAVAVTVAGILLVRPRVSGARQRHGGHRGRGVHGGLVGHEVVTLDVVGGPGPGRPRRCSPASGGGRSAAATMPLPAGHAGADHGRRGDDAHRVAGGGYLPVEASGRRSARRREVTDMVVAISVGGIVGIAVAVLVMGVVLLALQQMVNIVQQGEVGVVKHLGEYRKTHEPGW